MGEKSSSFGSPNPLFGGQMEPQVSSTGPRAIQLRPGDPPPLPRSIPSPAAGSRGGGGDHAASGTAQLARWSGVGRVPRGQRQRGQATPRPRGASFLARKGAIVCSYSWYVRPQAEGAPPPEGPGRGRRAEAGRMRAGAHLPPPRQRWHLPAQIG